MNQINVHQLDLPIDFRQEFFTRLFKIIRLSESGMVIGPAGMGKTLSLEFLEHPEVQNFYFPNQKLILYRVNLQIISPEEIIKLIESSKDIETKIVILADNAEALDNPNGKAIVQSLKNIRELNRPQISIFLVAERNVLGSESFLESSSLRSIFLENVIYLPPLSEVDSKNFAKAIAKQIGFEIPSTSIKKIVELASGAPRLIKRLVKFASEDEQKFKDVLANPSLDEKLSFDLETIKIFTKNNPGYNFNLPLFGLSKEPVEIIGNIEFTTSLTKQEFALAKILIETGDKLVTREEMIKAIWPKNLYETSEHALDQMIHRLKNKLKSATPKTELVTLRGRGAKVKII